MSKYNAKKCIIDDIKFDSTMEGKFYEHLKFLKSIGTIKAFSLQPQYTLIPSYIKNGKKVRPVTYVADFLVEYSNGDMVVIDIKGMEVPVAKLKRKLFDYFYPELQLKWITRSLKYGDEYGWITIEDLKLKRRKQ